MLEVIGNSINVGYIVCPILVQQITKQFNIISPDDNTPVASELLATMLPPSDSCKQLFDESIIYSILRLCSSINHSLDPLDNETFRNLLDVINMAIGNPRLSLCINELSERISATIISKNLIDILILFSFSVAHIMILRIHCSSLIPIIRKKWRVNTF